MARIIEKRQKGKCDLDENERRTCQRVWKLEWNNEDDSDGECDQILPRIFDDRLRFEIVVFTWRSQCHCIVFFSLCIIIIFFWFSNILFFFDVYLGASTYSENLVSLFLWSFDHWMDQKNLLLFSSKWWREEMRKRNRSGVCNRIIMKKENIRTIDSLYREKNGARGSPLVSPESFSFFSTMTRNVHSWSCSFLWEPVSRTVCLLIGNTATIDRKIKKKRTRKKIDIYLWRGREGE